MKKLLIMLVLCLIPMLAAGQTDEEEYICAQPGDSGADVRIVLEAARGLGFLPNLPDDEDNYREEYISAVKSAEKTLSLEEDGIVYLSELKEIDGAVGKGGKGPCAQELLERLFDMGYIKKVLPELHDVYEATYEPTVKKMEKALGLNADGIITGKEWAIIRSQRLESPDPIKNIKGTTKNKKAVLTWPAVRGAAYYRIIRNGTLLCELNAADKNQFTDDEISPDGYWSYIIIPYGYHTSGNWSEKVMVATTAQVKSIKTKQPYIVVRSGEKVNPEDYYTVEPAEACKTLSWSMTGGNENQKANGLVSSAELENDGSNMVITGYYFSAGVYDEKNKLTGKTIDGSNKSVAFNVYVLNESGSTLFNYGDKWVPLSNGKLEAQFYEENFKYGKEISAFEMSVIVTDVSGESTNYRVKTNTRIAPGGRAWSNKITISNRSMVKELRWWPSKIWYSDGSVLEVDEKYTQDSSWWEVDDDNWN